MSKRIKEIEKIITPLIKEECPYIDVVIIRRRYGFKNKLFGKKPYDVLLGLDLDDISKFNPVELNTYIKTIGKYIICYI